MLCRKFKLTPIKIGISFKNSDRIFKVAQKLGKSPCTIVHGRWPKVARRILHWNFKAV